MCSARDFLSDFIQACPRNSLSNENEVEIEFETHKTMENSSRVKLSLFFVETAGGNCGT
jgi:hypothetical protein